MFASMSISVSPLYFFGLFFVLIVCNKNLKLSVLSGLSGRGSISDTPVGTEELGHLEMICAIVHQLTKDLPVDEIKRQGFEDYYVDHTLGIYPTAASGNPFSASGFQSKGDPIADLIEDLAAEQKARVTYDNILRLTDDDDVRQPIKFLRQREVVHFQRFGEALEKVKDELNAKNYYAYNPSFDKKPR